MDAQKSEVDLKPSVIFNETKSENIGVVESDGITEGVTEGVPKEEHVVEKPSEVDDDPKFMLGDKEYTVSQIAELEKGNMRQDDYTKKTQEVATARREIEEYANKQALADYYKSNPQAQPTAAQSTGAAITDDDLALMEPEVRRLYEVEIGRAHV